MDEDLVMSVAKPSATPMSVSPISADVKVQGTVLSISKAAMNQAAEKKQQVKVRKPKTVAEPVSSTSSLSIANPETKLVTPKLILKTKPMEQSTPATPATPSIVLKVGGGAGPSLKLNLSGMKRKRDEGDFESAATPVMRKKRPLTEFNNLLESICSEVSKLPNSWPFREPVKAKDAPNYYDIIKSPKDLGTIHKVIEDMYK